MWDFGRADSRAGAATALAAALEGLAPSADVEGEEQARDNPAGMMTLPYTILRTPARSVIRLLRPRTIRVMQRMFIQLHSATSSKCV